MPPEEKVPGPVWVPVDGTVVDWAKEIQVNPQTGQRFDFNGKLIYEPPVDAHGKLIP